LSALLDRIEGNGVRTVIVEDGTLSLLCGLPSMLAQASGRYPLDLDQCSCSVLADRSDMNPPEAIGKKAPKPKPSRLETARSVIEQYAGDLRKIIKKLRQRPSLKMPGPRAERR
jgi:hypothetical protein